MQVEVERFTKAEVDVEVAGRDVDVLIDVVAQLPAPGRVRAVELRSEIEVSRDRSVGVGRLLEQQRKPVAAR